MTYEVLKTNLKKTYFPSLIFIIFVIGISLGIAVGRDVSKASNGVNGNKSSITKKDLSEVEKIYNDILKNYYKDVKKEDLVEGAIKGMLESLDDEYSSYLDEEENEEFELQMEGSYEGIGVSLNDKENVGIVIIEVFSDSPAEKVGIKANDIIISIDGTDFSEKSASDVANYVRKSNLKDFDIVVKRGTENKKFSITRSRVEIKSVTTKTYYQNNQKIGYLKINVFAANTTSQFLKELETLEKSGIDGLIVDLRNNSGGYLSAVTTMTSAFLDKTKVIYKTDFKGKIETFNSNGKITKKYPIVMLGNEGSASASEIMIAAMVDSYGADFVGTKTYGKGTVQELKDYSTTESFKFTVKKWLTPNGEWINEKGIIPTHLVELSEDFLSNPIDENDNQLKKALELIKWAN